MLTGTRQQDSRVARQSTLTRHTAIEINNMKLMNKSRGSYKPTTMVKTTTIVEGQKDIAATAIELQTPKPKSTQTFVPPLPRQQGESSAIKAVSRAAYWRRRVRKAGKEAARARREANQAREAREDSEQLAAYEQVQQAEEQDEEVLRRQDNEVLRRIHRKVQEANAQRRMIQQQKRQTAATVLTAAARGRKIRDLVQWRLVRQCKRESRSSHSTTICFEVDNRQSVIPIEARAAYAGWYRTAMYVPMERQGWISADATTGHQDDQDAQNLD